MRKPLLVFLVALLSCLFANNLIAQNDIPLFWANRIGSAWFDEASDIYVDNSGDVYVTGSIDDPATITPASPSISLPFYGGKDAFIAKYNALGNVQYIHIIGGEDEEVAAAIVADSLGNIYVTGWFEGTVDFDPSEATFNLTSQAGSRDAFLAKFDLNGNFIFAFSLGDNYTDLGVALALDSESNIIVGGKYTGTIDFDPSANTENVSSTFGGEDIFLAKYDSDGNYLFAISMGGNSADELQAIELDKDDFIHVTGAINFMADFDPSAEVAAIGDVQWESFIAKYTPNGEYVYAKSFGGPETGDGGYALALDSLSNLYVAGIFTDTGDFDPGPNEALLYAEGHYEMFLAKYNPNGEYIFAKRIGGIGLDQPHGMTMDEDENLYLTGRFGATVDFDPSSSIDTIINSNAAFIAKYDNTGKYQYAQSTRGEDTEFSRAIAVFGQNNIYITGTYRGTTNFAVNGDTEILTTAGYEDVFVARYTTNPTSTAAPEGITGMGAFLSNNSLMLSYLGTENLDHAIVRLYDMAGKVVFTKQLTVATGMNTVANLSGMANGVYLFQLTANNKVYHTKLARF